VLLDEAAKVLAIAATFDARLKPPSPQDARLRAEAWRAALIDRMDPRWAQDAVVAHYASSTEALMPAHLNRAWKAFRESESMRKPIERGEGVPMPPEIRDQIQTMLRQKSV
jgi:hypothetical protein